jgi:hypothetical protein
MNLNIHQDKLFILISILMVSVPFLLILRYFTKTKGQQERFEDELRSITRQWENRK